MNPTLRKTLYGVLALLLVIDFYLIFNAGNPNSIFRGVIPDPAYDVSVTVGLSLLIVVISLAMASDGNQNSLRKLLKRNETHIREMRAKGHDEYSIAISFVNELGVRNRLIRRVLERRVSRLLRTIGQ